jgi:medium-chain acyl-[acyl-carrier-protein] hydrolase
MTTDNPWVLKYQTRPNARVRLLCFPHAGSSAAAFGPWASRLPEDIDVWAVEYPGRGTRRPEAPFVRMHALVAALLEGLGPELTPPFAIFGHSMGGLIGFEFARQLRRHSPSRPVALFVAGCRAPSLPSRKRPLHALSDQELLEELKALNGTPDEMLRNVELTRLFLPALKADYELVDTYVHRPAATCGCRIFAYGGAADRETLPEELRPWALETDVPLVARLYAGDHFFLRGAESEVLRDLTADLSGVLEGEEVAVTRAPHGR